MGANTKPVLTLCRNWVAPMQDSRRSPRLIITTLAATKMRATGLPIKTSRFDPMET